MTRSHPAYPGHELELFAAAEAAIAQIPPAFPLDATVAVNPFLGQIGESRAQAAARLARVAGVSVFRDRAELAAMLDDGRLTAQDLAAAAAADGELTPQDLRAALTRSAEAPQALPTVADLLEGATGVDWPEFIADRVGCWAASRFDRGQALWPAAEGGLYATWLGFARRDLTTEIAGLSGFCADVAALPDTPRGALVFACETLGIGADAAETYFHRLLMTLGGWAQYARHLGWLAARDGGSDPAATELLTIRLVWDALLYHRHADRLAEGWAESRARYAAPLVASREVRIDAALQEAADRAAERALSARFLAPRPGAAAEPPALQAAFCIDVRSETLRRALETADPGIETIGFAGFFGLAVSHRAVASDIAEARGPVLLRPAVETTVETPSEADTALRIRRRAHRAWGRFRVAAVSAFAFVEAAGPLYLAKLLRDAAPGRAAAAAGPAPRLSLPLTQRVDAAAKILRAMSLGSGRFARLVLIAGHGSAVTNAPHASALQCGACGGHAGDVNARLLAGLLNDPEVRDGLSSMGIRIPQDTHFVAGLHDTVSDDVTLYDDQPSKAHAADLARLATALKRAGMAARMERAARLPRAGDPEALPLRGGDWSEVRPEWGLAGCSAFIAAPRWRTAGLDLGGRAFLHDYDWGADDGFGTLELILTAPVVVASWISLQYAGSALAPQAFGAGNKLLHNVVGGIGVVEGNGGLLRAGLPWQSVHDGERLQHEPVRLKVVVEAPTEAIAAILSRNPQLRALFDNGWLALFAMDAEGRIAARYDRGTWIETDAAAAQRRTAA